MFRELTVIAGVAGLLAITNWLFGIGVLHSRKPESRWPKAHWLTGAALTAAGGCLCAYCAYLLLNADRLESEYLERRLAEIDRSSRRLVAALHAYQAAHGVVPERLEELDSEQFGDADTMFHYARIDDGDRLLHVQESPTQPRVGDWRAIDD